MTPPPRQRKVLVIVTLVALVSPLVLAALSAAPANAAANKNGRAVALTSAVTGALNSHRTHAGLRPLLVGGAVTCQKRAAETATGKVRRNGALRRAHARSAARDCGTPVLGYASARAKSPAAAKRGVLRKRAVRNAVTKPAAHGLAVSAARMPDRTWTIVALVTAHKRPTHGTPPAPGHSDPTPEPSHDAQAAQMRNGIYEHTNIARAKNNGGGPLAVEACLQANAQRWAEFLADRDGALEHQDLNGVFVECGSRGLVGENIAYNFTNSGETMTTMWMNSPGHRANILNADFTRIGVGVVKSATGRWYGVQVFGATPW